jgi:ribosomal-protein-alanine N-acetyltransferase
MANESVSLIPTEEKDLHVFFQFQLDEEANYLAAFTPKDPHDKTAHLDKYRKIVADPTKHTCTISFNN